MSIKLALLKSGETIISDAKELIVDENPLEDNSEDQFKKVFRYLFIKPHKIEIRKQFVLVEENETPKGDLEIVLSPWIVLTNDEQIPVDPDWIVTIVDPIDSIKEMYEEKVNG
jgi:hypothetical protein